MLASNAQLRFVPAANFHGTPNALTVRLVETEALQFCLDAVLEGSVAEGAALEFVSTPGAGWCAACARTVPLHERYAPCPHCGAYGLDVRGGAQMRVSALEVD